MNRELEEKARLLQLITDNMFDLVALTDPKGHYKYLGKSHEILGYKLDDLIGENVMNLVHPEDFENVMDSFQSFLENHENGRRIKYRIRRQDGSYLWLETMGKVLTDENGQIEELLFSSRDITQQKEAERKLRESEKTYRELFNCTLDALFLHDIHTGKILDVNDTMLKAFGYTREEASSLTVEDLSGGDALQVEEKAADLIKRCAAGKNISFEWICKRKNGETFPTENHLHRVTIAGENYIMATVRDITDRKQAEKELEANRSLLNSMFNSIQDGISILGPDFTIREVNHVVKELHAEIDSFTGEKCYHIYANRSEPCVNCPAVQALETKTVQKEILPLRVKGHHYGWLEVFAYPILNPSTGEIDGVVEFVRDITERKETEEKLKTYAQELEKKNTELDIAAYQAEEANQAKSRFVATMNHEIRTPINGLMGFLQILEETPLNQDQSTYLSYMNQSAQHLLGLVNNVLDMAKIEAGEMELDHRPFNLADTIDASLASLYPMANEKDLQLIVEKDSGLPIQVMGDSLRLRQIILNLAGNAVKFTEKGFIRLKVESLGRKEGKHQLHLEIQDTGPGMDQRAVDQVFQPFFRDRDNNPNHPGGTGLGMSITRELVERMDGRIHVHSTPGEGTIVMLRLNLEEVVTSLGLLP